MAEIWKDQHLIVVPIISFDVGTGKIKLSFSVDIKFSLMQHSRSLKIAMFDTRGQGETFKKNSVLIHTPCKTLENSRGFTAANFCSPEARGMCPLHWNEPVFSRY